MKTSLIRKILFFLSLPQSVQSIPQDSALGVPSLGNLAKTLKAPKGSHDNKCAHYVPFHLFHDLFTNLSLPLFCVKFLRVYYTHCCISSAYHST